ncbi:MAG: hypothetical protein HQK65_02580 [Desulfamplus sp.]|nr:hypothetical protein [Desulfamplus sp.]
MALDSKKLQKKKTKKAAKQKARQNQRKKSSVIKGLAGSTSIKYALEAPVHECWMPETLFKSSSGVGTVVISRKTRGHEILMAGFLLDVFCLGVKDAYIRTMSEKEYQLQLEYISANEFMKKIDSSCARKLIEGAEQYAENLGLHPHKDYHAAKKIFGDIKVEGCADSFTFGKNGRPFYATGPHDSERFRRNIINQLTKTCGADGFEHLLIWEDELSL